MIHDDFSSATLDAAWAAAGIASQSPALDLTAPKGALRIHVPAGRTPGPRPWAESCAAVTRTDLGAGNFAIETHLMLDANTEGARFTAGLAVCLADGDLIMWGLTGGTSQIEASRTGSGRLTAFRGWDSPEVHLRIEKSGDTYSFFHKAAPADRWVADGQYRPCDEAVEAVGLGVRTGDDDATVTARFGHFAGVQGTAAPDTAQQVGDVRSFGNICTRWVPVGGPLISVPPNIPGQISARKNVRFILPDTTAFDRTAHLDSAPQLFRDDLDGEEWTLETVVTMVYTDPEVARGGLFLQLAETDVIIFAVTGTDQVAAHRTGVGEIASVRGTGPQVWLRITRCGGQLAFGYRTGLDAPWQALTTLAEDRTPARGGVIVCTPQPANAAVDFAYLHVNEPKPEQHPVTAPLTLPVPPPAVHLPTAPSGGTEPQETTRAGEVLVLESEYLRLEIDAHGGRIRRLTNTVHGIDLLRTDPVNTGPAWRIETVSGSAEEGWLTPAAAGAVFTGRQYPDRLDLSWICADGLTVHAIAFIDAPSGELRFGIEVTNRGDTQVVTVEYPRIDAITSLGAPGTDDYLLHPYAGGFLFRNPVDLFPAGGGIPAAPYPEGFNGASTQVMAYYREHSGGFGFWVDDPTGWVKWLDCFKPAGSEDLTVRFLHSTAGIEPGNELTLPYTVRIGALHDGTWYEAAERYRDWATTQVFCELGPLHSREHKATWLLEDVGLATFGLSTQYDRRPWLEYFREIAGTPVFHVTGPNWQHHRYDYLGNQNGGTDGVLPHAVTKSYLNTVRGQGDYFATFAFGTLFSDITSADHADAQAAFQRIPGTVDPQLTNRGSRDAYAFPFLCPVAGALTRLSVHRDSAAVSELGADGVYYDIGPNNVMMRCLSPDHGHPVGGGNALVDGYKQMMSAVRTATAQAAGRYVPLGCELVSETFVPYQDFYQGRAEASPSSSFEAWSFHEWIKQGQCLKVPLFAFIYHEYGPTRLDGWGRLDTQQGDLFYWIAARVYAWGGIYELNSEFSSLNTVDGHADDVTEGFSPFAVDRYYPVDRAKAEFLTRMAAARTTFANKYLAYGQMARPLPIGVPEIDLDWFHFNSPPDSLEYQDAGTLTVPAVVQCCWRFRAESFGCFLVNLTDEPVDVAVELDPSTLGLTPGDVVGMPVRLTAATLDGVIDLGALAGPTTVPLTVPARAPLLLEVGPAAAAATMS